MRIMFICHGNICRSTMAQFVTEDLVKRARRSAVFVIDSAATSTEEIGMPPHPGTVRKLREVGVPVHAHRARQITRSEYAEWDAFVYMDEENARGLRRIFGDDPEGKCVKLLAFAGLDAEEDGGSAAGACADECAVAVPLPSLLELSARSPQTRDVADPWYTGNFDETYRDVLAGCAGLLAWANAR